MAISLREMADPTSWISITASIRRFYRGAEQPDPAHLAAALKRHDKPVPEIVRDYLAGLLIGNFKKKQGPKPRLGPAAVFVWRVVRFERVYRDRFKCTNPLDRAFEAVAKERGMDAASAERNFRRYMAQLRRQQKTDDVSADAVSLRVVEWYRQGCPKEP